MLGRKIPYLPLKFETLNPYVEFHKPLILVDCIAPSCMRTHSILLCSFLCQLVKSCVFMLVLYREFVSSVMTSILIVLLSLTLAMK
jgi:hypothetical protein